MRRLRRAAPILALLVLAACATQPSTASPMPAESAAALASAAPHSVPAAAVRGVIGGGPERVFAQPPSRPAQPALAARYEAALVPDSCTDRDLAAPPADDVVLTVLDRSYALPASYAPDDLVPAAEAGFIGPSGTKLVRAVVLDDLAAMREAWAAAGLTIAIDSAYRSYQAQAATFDSWVARIGFEEATVRTARPGHSEHQLGTAVDVSSPGWAGRFGDWAVETAEGAWMAEHAWEFGFVMSYPPGAEPITCFGYEPWHYRWIGREAAAEHRRSELPLREVLERYVRG